MERKQVQADKTMADLEVRIGTEMSFVENLDFHVRISAEVARTRQNEVSELENKARDLSIRINAAQVYKNTEQFQKQYFGM